MAAATMKHMALNFAKLNKFEGVDFKRWQKKMHFLLSSMSVVRVVTTLIPEDGLQRFNPQWPNIWPRMHQCGKPGHSKKDCKGGEVGNKANGSGTNGSSNSLKGATVHVRKDRCWFKTSFMSTFKLNDSIIWHARLVHVHFKRIQDMSKDGLILAFDMDTENDLCDLHATPSLGNKKYFVTFIDDASRFCYVYLLHTKDEALDKFKVFKTEVELQQGSLVKRFMIDRGGKYGTEINGQFHVVLLKTESRRLGAVVRLPKPKLKTLGERGFECIIVGYVEHSKAFRFYVIEPNESVSINSIIEPIDAIFDENRFSSVSRP
ncbi:zinc finger, CCHC-type containing protein, partial [Tanacetum coccineum]